MPITRRRRANPPDQPENNNHLDQNENGGELSTSEQDPFMAADGENTTNTPVTERVESPVFPPIVPSPLPNGDRPERQEFTPPIEGGRRTARGELFRRPPQPPTNLPANPPSSLQAPSHEIALPLGNLLHLAYNPGYTGSDESRSVLLHQLANESKAGGRARCWNCGSISIVYDCWNTRSKTFGEVGVAFCEICGVWSVM